MITTLSTNRLSIIAFSITTFVIMILGIRIKCHYAECRTVMLNVNMLSDIILNFVAPYTSVFAFSRNMIKEDSLIVQSLPLICKQEHFDLKFITFEPTKLGCLIRLRNYFGLNKCIFEGVNINFNSPGNPYWRGRLSAVGLLIKIGCFVQKKYIVS